MEAMEGRSSSGLPMIAKSLGDPYVQTTARYAHLAADPVKNAADAVSGRIAASFQGSLLCPARSLGAVC